MKKLILLFLLLIPAFIKAQGVELIDVVESGDSTCWYYRITGPGNSHSTFGDSTCSNTCLDDEGAFWSNHEGELGPDPTSGICGFKTIWEVTTDTILIFCTPGSDQGGSINVAYKVGQVVTQLVLPGPCSLEPPLALPEEETEFGNGQYVTEMIYVWSTMDGKILSEAPDENDMNMYVQARTKVYKKNGRVVHRIIFKTRRFIPALMQE